MADSIKTSAASAAAMGARHSFRLRSNVPQFQVLAGSSEEWPTWTPPAEMVARDPNAAKWAGGQPGGPDNPLGARALYLYEGDQDTIYRIHGTPETWSIGLDVSSGCIRMNNVDIVDLHSRIDVGARVIVLMQGASLYKGV